MGQLAANHSSEERPETGEGGCGSRARQEARHHSELRGWGGGVRRRLGAHLPAAFAGLLFEVQAPALGAGLPTVVHGEDDGPGEQDSGGPTANDGTQQGLTAG